MPFDSVTPEALPDVRPGYAAGRAALYRAGAFFLAHPDQHCKDSAAKDERGMSCNLLDQVAVRWCAAGRILFELGLQENKMPQAGSPAYAAFDLVGKALRSREPNRLVTITTWNDYSGRSPKEVAELLMAAALYEEPCAPPDAPVHTIVYEEDTHAF